jgi:hypothetical protein
MIVVPSGFLDTIVQSSGGTTLQRGYGGLQLHKKAYQRKVKTAAQQAQRNNFKAVQSGWSALTVTQQEGWYAAAVPPESGFQLYSRTNNSTVAAGGDIIPAYTTPVTPVIINADFQDSSFSAESDGNHLTIITHNTGDALPVTDWVTNIYYSGWIGPSVYRFPPARLKIPNSIVGLAGGDLIEITIEPEFNPNLQPPAEFWKANFQFSMLNTVTGQIATGNLLTIVATNA